MGFVKESKNTKVQSKPLFAIGKSRRLLDVETVGGHKEFESVKPGAKRKREYADKFLDKERMNGMNAKKVEKPLRKFVSRITKNKVDNILAEEKPMRRGKPKYAESMNKEDSFKGRSKLKENGKSRGNVKNVIEVQDAEADKFNTGYKSKLDAARKLEKNQDKRASEFILSAYTKKFQSKKSILDDEKEPEERPKKKKRVIRIDPYDDSNKRLDDGIITNNVKEKEVQSKSSDVKLSMNAQFRAIRPSPSILSYVEDNLLGRRREIEFKRAGYNIELPAPLDNIPFSTSTERERIEDVVFRKKLDFIAAAKVSSSFPPPDLPEVAFAGRSNVGKSSLLNSLTRQWSVARTSDKPGLTQSINFFQRGSRMCLVDLPGYGFAYAKDEVKEAWEELVKEYVSTRSVLKRVCLLIDTKWGMRPKDFELIDLMERYQTKYQIVLTKTDLVFPIDVARRAMQIEENLKQKKSAVQPVMMVSSHTGAGIRCLRTALSTLGRVLKTKKGLGAAPSTLARVLNA